MSNISETNLKKRRKIEENSLSSHDTNSTNEESISPKIKDNETITQKHDNILKEVLESNKISFSKIEDLDNFKNFLYKKESEYSKKIAQVKMLVKETNRNIAKRCEEKHNNHKWIRERENCMYGSTFTICANCRIDYYDRTYIHY